MFSFPSRLSINLFVSGLLFAWIIFMENASEQMNYGRGRMRVFGFGQNEEKSSVLRNV